MDKLVRPSLFAELITAGRWPISGKRQMPLETVHRIAPDEGELNLSRPPFVTLREAADPSVMSDPLLNPPGIDFDLALYIGDFGCDAPLLLDYQIDASRPRVVRLQWVEGNRTRWTVVADDLESFIKIVGL